MKKKLLTCILLCSIFFMSCEESEKYKEGIKEKGRQAAVEFCDCYETKSKDDCLKELTKKYSKTDYMNNDFISAFNERSTCGIELEKIFVPQ